MIKKLLTILLLQAFACSGMPVFSRYPQGTNNGIVVSTDALHNFLEVYEGMVSDVQFYEVSAHGLSHDLIISVEEPFRISLDCFDAYGNSIVLQPSAGSIAETQIFVRFFPQATGTLQALILHQSEGFEPSTVSAAGTCIENQIPENYYSTATATGRQLKTQLFNIIKDHNVAEYSSLWQHFETTDAMFSGHVWDIYSDIYCGHPPYLYEFNTDQDKGSGGNSEDQFFNREHSMPLSWYGGQVEPMATDIFHIYPVDKYVNGLRANFPFGQVNNPTRVTRNGGKLGPNALTGYSGTAFEPVDAFKGDLARTYFYMATRYENLISQWNHSTEGNNVLAQNTYPGFKTWVKDMLLEWHASDPVSQKEVRRNNAVYLIQGNRNPFIDHPEFVNRIWGDTTTSIESPPQNIAVSVYPNPASSFVTVASDHRIDAIEIYSISGRIISRHNTEAFHYQVMLPAIPPGVYIIRLQLADSAYNRLLIIQ